MVRIIAAAAIAALVAEPAAAATITVRNCAGQTLSLEVRDQSTPSGPVRSSTSLDHGQSWVGSCNSAHCWLTARGREHSRVTLTTGRTYILEGPSFQALSLCVC
ncbi:MAG: hypothetical protein AB7O45_10465 [Alphaproteobacteria bacterium]